MDKLVSLQEAMAIVKDGDTVALGGTAPGTDGGMYGACQTEKKRT